MVGHGHCKSAVMFSFLFTSQKKSTYSFHALC